MLFVTFLIWPSVGKAEESDLLSLKKAKSYLLNGNLKMAEFFLNRVVNPNSHLFIVKKRYEALKFFLEEKYDKSYSILEEAQFHRLFPYKEICLQKLLIMMFANKMKNFQEEFQLCSYINRHSSKNGPVWINIFQDILENADLNDFRTYTDMRIKAALYLNKEQFVLDNIEDIPKEVLESPQTKELLAIIYYRLGDYSKALKLIENYHSVNAENIRANIALKKKDYAKAYKYFKLALEKRPNSLNAFNGIVLTSWMLKKWDEGIKILSSLPLHYGDLEKRSALESAFYLKLGQVDKADRSFRRIKTLLHRKKRTNPSLSLPKGTVLMQSYLALTNNDKRELIDSSRAACEKFDDGLNCWIILQQLLWKNFSLNINRDKPIHKTAFTIESLKKRQEIIPLLEEIPID